MKHLLHKYLCHLKINMIMFAPLKIASCWGYMRCRQVLPDACVTVWKHVKRHRSHHGGLQIVSMCGRAISNSGKCEY